MQWPEFQKDRWTPSRPGLWFPPPTPLNRTPGRPLVVAAERVSQHRALRRRRIHVAAGAEHELRGLRRTRKRGTTRPEQMTAMRTRISDQEGMSRASSRMESTRLATAQLPSGLAIAPHSAVESPTFATTILPVSPNTTTTVHVVPPCVQLHEL